MKKAALSVACLLGIVELHAQIFTDGFESAEGYSINDHIGPGPNGTYWTTWSGTEGGAEDAQVTDAQAANGLNSIYFSSTSANGGPQDVVLEFGSQYTDGLFTFESAFFVENGAGAYFNFQATQTIGQSWAMNCNMSNGSISIDDGTTSNLATGSYTPDTWFTLRIEANLTLGLWEAFVDGNSIGIWLNGIGTIASLDLYPLLGHSFYVDDVMFDHQTVTLSNLNATAGGLNMGGNIAGLNVNPTVTVVNAGINDITSFDVTLDYNGNQYNEVVSGITLTSLNSYEVTFTSAIPLAAGANTATATVSNVNGGTDDDSSDDANTIAVNPVVPAPGKVVVGEEGTGTWCGWCPRGAVYMDLFAAEYGQYWAGVAIHNGDPMVVSTYDSGIGGLISGYPSALVDRVGDVNPSQMSNDFFTRLQTAPTALISNDATWDPLTRQLSVTVSANFQAAANSNYRLACVLTEDGVTGSASGYAQANYYAGGGSGVMGGYESLPNPVPAAQMVYDHVARAIEPSFLGDNTVFPATVNIGETHSGTYSFTLPVEWNEANMHIIGMMIDNQGLIDNATVSTIPGSGAGIDCQVSEARFNIFPNPAKTAAVLEIITDNPTQVEVRLIDMSGKVLTERNYGFVSTTSTVQLNTLDLQSGVYLVEVTMDGKRKTRRMVVQ